MCKTMHLSVEGLIIEKERLEATIAKDIAALITNFRETTGLDVRGVDVSFTETTTLASKHRCFRVAGCSVTTNLI